MSTHVVILGAGFGGLELASRLSDSVADEARVTLIDQNDSFYFGFAKLDVLLGRKTASEVRLPYSEIAKDGVEFRQERVTAIDPDTRTVTTEQGSYEADLLVIALGADYDFGATPGFQEGDLEYYTLGGAERLRDALEDFNSGKVLIGILGHPFKCPPAPFEGAFLLHDRFVERGIRDVVEIRVIGPQSAPVPVTPEVSQSFLDALAERDIEYVPNQHIVEVDTGRKEVRLEGGGTAAYDLFIGVPVHRVPDVVARAGLAPDGWVAVNTDNLATSFPGVYAVGDLAALPGAKAGVFAENAAKVVADDIVARLTGSDPPQRYEHNGTCYIEFGGGNVAKVEANFLGGPKPTARIVGPSQELAADKREFAATRRARWFGS
jgi:sulfide:quinone oxidoreductase